MSLFDVNLWSSKIPCTEGFYVSFFFCVFIQFSDKINLREKKVNSLSLFKGTVRKGREIKVPELEVGGHMATVTGKQNYECMLLLSIFLPRKRLRIPSREWYQPERACLPSSLNAVRITPSQTCSIAHPIGGSRFYQVDN